MKKKREYDLQDFLEQLQRVKRMGSLTQLPERLPGLRSFRWWTPAREMQDPFFTRVEAVILSMTPEERRHPEIIDGSRRERIARGSGTTHWDVAQVARKKAEPARR
jgi:signal recognition particle subunit SRP54